MPVSWAILAGHEVRMVLRVLMLAGVFASAVQAQAADCPDPRSTSDLRASLERAQATFAELDVAGFADAVSRAERDLPCVNDTVSRSLAAEYHRFVGLKAFVDQDPATSTLSFAAARAIEPAYRFPESFIPPGNPIIEEYDAVDISAGAHTAVAAPVSGTLRFDGREELQRPDAWPTVVQLVSDTGAVTWTAYVRQGQPLPAYDARALPKAPPSGGESARGGGPNVALLGGGAGSLALSAVFVGLAAGAHARFADETTPYDQVDHYARKANTMSTTGAVVGVLGLGLTGASFVVRGH